MKQRLTLALFFLCTLFLSAQKDIRLAQNLSSLSHVPQLVMPIQDNASLMAEELERRGPNTAPRYATNLEVNITPQTAGTWEEKEDGTMVWRLRIKSADAYSINLGFSQYYMPSSGKLLLYSPDYSRVMGPFTPADNEEHEQLWTPIIDGDELVIELQLARNQVNDLDLKLSYVNHAFQDFSAAISGSCNLDVICGGADGWGIVDAHRDIIQSVAVISTGGGTFCTGFLVNNVQEDCTPFFMTANHCGIDAGNAASLVTYWNFINSTCRQPFSAGSGSGGDGQLNDFNTGAIFRSARSTSDFTLVELDDPVSPTANAFFAGWDATASAVSSAIGVHHPSTDEKRISFENDALQFTNGFGTTPSTNFTHVRVPDWDVGTTEPGSSGSPLFDQNDRVIGQLHGGSAACGNNSSDWYGAFATSWDAGASASARLKDWLDPSNTGTLVVNGRYANSCTFSIIGAPSTQTICSPLAASYSIEVSDAFFSTVSLSVTGLPSGASATFTPSNVAPGGSSTLTIFTNTANAGTYTLTVTANDGSNTAETNLSLVILDGSTVPPSLVSPSNNSIDVFPNPIFSWTGDDSGATTYDIEIASNSSFSNIIETGTTTNTSYQSINISDGLTTYYWRVSATNDCGSSISSSSSFTTQNVNCITYRSSSISTISDVGEPTVLNDIFINDDYTIAEIIVDMDITHSYVGDLDATLFPAAGSAITLFDRPGFPNDNFGCSEDNMLVSFSDNSPNSAADLENTCNSSDTGPDNPGAPYAIEGSFNPIGSLSSLNNQSSQGLWTLELNDNAAADGGVLESWSVTICYVVESSPPVIITNNTLEVPRGDQEDITQIYLEVEDDNSSPSEIIFTLTNLPDEGDLLLNGSMLSVGATFTQADINNGLLTYAHNGGIVLDDQFEFDVANSAGVELIGNLFLIQITVAPMVVNLQQINTIACNGDMTASLTVIVSGGLPPYDYVLNNGDFQSLNLFSGLGAGTYVVTVLDDLGNEIDSPSFSISQPVVLSGSTTVNSADITVTANGGTPPYMYSLDGGMTTQGSNVFPDLANGDYTITIIDANNCLTTTTAIVSVNTLVVAAALAVDISCNNANDAIITVLASGGTPPYSYSINNENFQDNNLFEDLAEGNYQITVMDAENFLNTTASIQVTNPPLLVASASTDLFTITTSADGGIPPYSYSINGGTDVQNSPVFNNLSNGNYTVTILDANNCSSTVMVTIAVNTLAISTSAINNISCFNANDGSFCIDVTGGAAPFQYSINGIGFQDENCFENLSPDSYQVTVRDSENFTIVSDIISISSPTALTTSVEVNMNTITVSADGGTPPYQYSVDGGENTQDSPVFNNLANGNYTVTILDANNCNSTDMATIAVNTLAISTSAINNISCFNANDGSFCIDVTGAAPPFQYSINGIGFQDENCFENLSPDSYQVTVRDSENFTIVSDIISISSPTALTTSVEVSMNTITVSADGGTPPYQYSVDGGESTQDSPVFGGLSNGNYSLVTLDANNCIVTDAATIAFNSLVVSAVLINDIQCFGINNGQIMIEANGGAAPYEYSLDGIDYQDENIFTNLFPGNYEIWVRDIDGFTRLSNPVPVSNPPLLTMDVQVIDNTVTIMANGGTGELMYSINGIDFQDENTFPDLADGIYQASVIDDNGCAVTDEIIVTINSLLATIQVTESISCFNANDAIISVTAEGGITPYEYSIDGENFQGGSSFQSLGAGSYTVMVRDQVGTVISTQTIQIDNPAVLSLNLSVTNDTIFVDANGGTGDYQYSIDGMNFQNQAEFTDLENGEYEIWVQDENGCLASEMTSILVNLFTIVQPDLTFELFPNPNQGQFQLTVQQPTGKSITCYIYNTAGQMILKKSFEKRQNTFQASFDLKSYPSGLYEIVLTDGILLGVSRVIVQE